MVGDVLDAEALLLTDKLKHLVRAGAGRYQRQALLKTAARWCSPSCLPATHVRPLGIAQQFSPLVQPNPIARRWLTTHDLHKGRAGLGMTPGTGKEQSREFDNGRGIMARIEVEPGQLGAAAGVQTRLAGRILEMAGQARAAGNAAAEAAGNDRLASAASDSAAAWSASLMMLSDSVGGLAGNLGAASAAYQTTDNCAIPAGDW